MRATATLLAAIAASAALVCAAAFAGDKDKPKPESEAEVRVVVLDPKGVPLGGDAASVTLNLDYGGFQKTLTADAVKAAPPAKAVAGSHGGQTSVSDGYSIEVIVVPRKGPKAAPPEGPYFKATTTIVGHQCSMKDAPPAEKPGKCAGCGMGMGEAPAPFKAAVVVKVGDKSVEAAGFTYPETVADATARIAALIDEIDGLVAGGKIAEVRGAGDRLGRVAARLTDAAEPLGKNEKIAAKKARDEITAALDALGKAADANKPDDVKAAAEKLRTKLEALQKIGK